MKNGQTHIIKRQSYEITLEKASDAHHYQSKVSRLQQDKINSTLNTVMGTYGAVEFLDRYKCIELDIGTLSPIEFETILDRKIEEALTYFLKDNTNVNGTLKQGERIPLYEKYLEQLDFFLQFGYLRWDGASDLKPKEIFEMLLENNSEELSVLLLKYGKDKRIQKRIIQQISDAFFEKAILNIAAKSGRYMLWCCAYFSKVQQEFVKVDSKHFKEFLHEIALVYVLEDRQSFSRQIGFFQYILIQLTEHFKLNYRQILEKLDSDSTEGEYHSRLKGDIEKLKIVFRETTEIENEIGKEIEALDVGDERVISFLRKLRYYLKYNLIGQEHSDSVQKKIVARLQQVITQHSQDFSVFLKELHQDQRAYHAFVKNFPNILLNSIVDQSQNKIVIQLLLFIKRLRESATYLKIESKTLIATHEQRGKTILGSFRNTSSGDQEQAIGRFLIEVIGCTTIDSEFVIILDALTRKETVGKKSILSFRKMFTSKVISDDNSREHGKLKANAEYLRLSQIIYGVYKEHQVLSLIDFQQKLIKEGYLIDTLKLAVHLLEIDRKESIYTAKDIDLWMKRRINELLQKGRNSAKIASQITDLLAQLSIDELIYSSVRKSLKTSLELKEGFSELHYDMLLETLQREISKYASQTGLERIYKRIITFAEKYKLKLSSVTSSLRNRLKERKGNELLKGLLDQIVLDNTITVPEKETTIFFRRDLIHFICVQGKLPWWAKNNAISSIQKIFQDIVTTHPEQLKKRYANSAHKKMILEYLGDSAYQMFNTNTLPFTIVTLIEIQEKLFTILHIDLAGIRHTALNTKNELRYLFVESLDKNLGKSAHLILNDFLIRVAKFSTIKREDLVILFHEKLQKEGVDATSEKWKTWIKEQIIPYPLVSIPMVGLTKLIGKEESWNETTSFPLDSQIIAGLKNIFKRSPMELRYHLKNKAFRMQLLKKMKPSSQIDFIRLLLDHSVQSSLMDTIGVFERMKTICNPFEYEAIWSNFIDGLLLKWSIDHTVSSESRKWSELLRYSLKPIQKTSRKKEIVDKLLGIEKPATRSIVEVLKQLLDNDATLSKQKKQPMKKIKEEQIGTSIHIGNAGLVILFPYIPMLFKRLDLLENNEFKDEASVQKGMDSLQYAAMGEQNNDEHILVLNKIICGKSIHEPLYTSIPLTVGEKEIINDMLNAVISAWTAIGNTTIAGLRETFLHREGSIRIEENKYTLQVEIKAFDMLLTQIPWNIKTLKLSWMHKLLEVIWK